MRGVYALSNITRVVPPSNSALGTTALRVHDIPGGLLFERYDMYLCSAPHGQILGAPVSILIFSFASSS